jgi:hypothetical protein
MFVKWKAVLALAVAAATVAGFPCLAAAEDYELLVVSSASNQVLRTDPDGHYLGAFTAERQSLCERGERRTGGRAPLRERRSL